MTLNGTFQTLFSVTAIFHAVVISPSSTEEVSRVQLCYSELENAKEGGETITVLSQAQVTAKVEANDTSFFRAELSANQIEAIGFGVKEYQGLLNAPLNYRRLNLDGFSPGQDLVSDFCKLRQALLQATIRLESRSEEVRLDPSVKERNNLTVIQDEDLDRGRQQIRTTAETKLTQKLIDEFLNSSDFASRANNQVLHDDLLSLLNTFFYGCTGKDFQWLVLQQGTPTQILGDPSSVQTNGASVSDICNLMASSTAFGRTDAFSGRISVAASSTGGGEKTSFFGTSSSSGGSSRWTHSLPPSSSDCYPKIVCRYVFNVFYPFIQRIACGMFKVDKDVVEKHIMHAYYQSKIRLIVLRLAHLYKQQFDLPWIDEWLLNNESFFKHRDDAEAFRWTLQLDPLSWFLNAGGKRTNNLSNEQGTDALLTLIRGFGAPITMSTDSQVSQCSIV